MILFAVLILVLFLLLLIKPLTEVFAVSAHPKSLTAVVLTIVLALVIGGYGFLGHFSAVHTFQKQQDLQIIYSKLIDKAGKEADELPAVFKAVKTRLDKNPTETIGWYVYGQLAVGMKKNDIAVEAFRTSVSQEPNNLDYLQALAQSLYQQSHGDKSVLNELHKTLNVLLTLDPENTSAQHLKAGLAFENKDYLAALHLWKQLLEKTENIEAQKLLASLVLRAKEEINLAHPQKVTLSINTEPSLLEDFPKNSTLFIAVKSNNSPMPIWAKKLPMQAVPGTIVLQASDAIANQLELDVNKQFELTVLVSKNNSPIKKENDLYFKRIINVTSSGSKQTIQLNKSHLIDN